MAAPVPENLMETFGSLFADFFQLSPDLGVDLRLTDAEAAAGVTRTIDITRRVPCGTCDGRGSPDPDPAGSEPCAACAGKGATSTTQGFFLISNSCKPCNGVGRIVRDPCKPCSGSGFTAESATLDVTIPAGIAHEQVVKLPGTGARKLDGTTGDVYVTVLVGDREDSRRAAFEAPIEPELPRAEIHNAKRPLPIAPILMIGFVIVILIALSR